MMDDLEQKLKEGLLENLIEHMSDTMGSRMKPKGVAVEVAAPDKARLAEGLDKAKGVVGSMPDHGEPDGDEAGGEDSDEERLMQLLAEGDDDEDDERLR